MKRLACIVLFIAGAAWGYRPFDGTDADVAGLGELELELGPAHYYRNQRAGYLIAPAAVLNLGVLPGVELVTDLKDFVGLSSVAGEQRARLLDTDLLLKWNYREGVIQEKSGLSMAVEAGLLAPEAGGEDGFGATANFIESYRWPALTLHLNSQVSYTRGHDLDLFQGLIAVGPFQWHVRPVAEVWIEHTFGVDQTGASALAGVIWVPRDGLAFDAALRLAHEDGQRALEIRAGFTWSFEVFGKPQ